MSSSEPAEVQATLETRHCTLRAFGSTIVEAYMTLHYAWQEYATQHQVSPNLVNIYRYSITYKSVPRYFPSGTALVDDEIFITDALDNFPPVLHHINRRNQIYFLHNAGVKDGVPVFTFSMDLSGELADELPRNHELYEAPNGMVFVRPKLHSLITKQEHGLLDRFLKANFREEAYKAELKKHSLVVHLADELDIDRILADQKRPESLNYRTAFKFDLVTKKTGDRKFIIRLLRSYDNRWLEYAEIKQLHIQALPIISRLATEIKNGLLHDLDDALFDS